MPRCIFCPETHLTREHIWPDWLVRKVHDEFRDDPGRYRVFDFDGSQHRPERTTTTIERTARVVCATCNNEWMGAIEGESIAVLTPLIDNPMRPRPITVEDQCVIATWVTLRAIVVDAATPREKPRYFTETERSDFSQTLCPPTTAYIWLAPYYGASSFTRMHMGRAIGPSGGLYYMTFVMKHIAIQFVTWHGDITTGLNFEHPGIEGFRNVSTLVWPSPGSDIRWQPSEYLGDNGLEAFCDRLRPPS
jgi:hypothetical protein